MSHTGCTIFYSPDPSSVYLSTPCTGITTSSGSLLSASNRRVALCFSKKVDSVMVGSIFFKKKILKTKSTFNFGRGPFRLRRFRNYEVMVIFNFRFLGFSFATTSSTSKIQIFGCRLQLQRSRFSGAAFKDPDFQLCYRIFFILCQNLSKFNFHLHAKFAFSYCFYVFLCSLTQDPFLVPKKNEFFSYSFLLTISPSSTLNFQTIHNIIFF